MAFVKKTWKDTIAQYPNRRTITDVSNTASVTTVEVVRAIGTVSQEGDAWNATNMNDLETRVKDAFDAHDAQLNGFTLWSGTQAQYNALGTYSNTTLYFITES